MSDRFDAIAVTAAAANSELAKVKFRDRGHAPIGYIKGMALVYARLCQHLQERDPFVLEMTKPVTFVPSKDVFAHYDLVTATDNRELYLQQLFVLLIGLGMRESSGNYCEGRDLSAHNTTADTAEAGLFQMSWDIHGASPLFEQLMKLYQGANSDYGLDHVFHEGVHVTERQLECYGAGVGYDFQLLAKSKPAFAVEAAAIGLRNRRTHWGPINRKEVEIRPESTVLLRQIEAIVKTKVVTGIIGPKPTGGLFGLLYQLFGGVVK